MCDRVAATLVFVGIDLAAGEPLVKQLARRLVCARPLRVSWWPPLRRYETSSPDEAQTYARVSPIGCDFVENPIETLAQRRE
jgi:hypothetical protein